MSIDSRKRGKLPSPGPFLAEITNHLDPSYMGSLEVVLIQNVVNPVSSQGGTYVVKYLSPFGGATSVRFEGNGPLNFNDVQKSYGFWMVPPDVGTIVMVIFVDGDPNQGYWFGCVQDTFQNHMVPGIAASEYINLTPEQRRKYDVNYLPVAEFNKSVQERNKTNVNTTSKPIHPFAERLLQQGLLADTIRGVTSSSARREVPSSVFGISTPGPLDKNGPTKQIWASGDRKAPVSRLGGTTFVMDDGDVNGQNELVRIRTRTGHQILMHNTKDLIYIANGKGTAWIEMTSKGKIDIYAQDSVSIHTEKDFNFFANGDINFEAAGNFNIRSGKDFKIETPDNLHLDIGQTGFITVTNGNLEVLTQGNNNFTAGANTNIRSNGQHLESASQIHMNGPAAEAAQSVTPIGKYILPSTRYTPTGWPTRYKGDDILTIVKRAPMHEPWTLHESPTVSEIPASAGPGRTTPYPNANVPPPVAVQAPAAPPPAVPAGAPATTVTAPAALPPAPPPPPPAAQPAAESPPPTSTTETLTFSADAWFDFDRSVLLPAGITALTNFADQLNQKIKQKGGAYNIIITGHTDSVGTDAYNISLSQRRANAAKTFLVSKGLISNFITTVGKGESSPVAPNTNANGSDNPAGRAQNRRVEIRVLVTT
jgi:outer membrane protein OmpA-like peptidoglycan-associated protein